MLIKHINGHAQQNLVTPPILTARRNLRTKKQVQQI